MLTKHKKAKIITSIKTHATDTGSPDVQVGILSERIDELTAHLQVHKKDKHSRRGLIGLVAKRRSLLKYLERHNKDRYTALLAKVGLKK